METLKTGRDEIPNFGYSLVSKVWNVGWNLLIMALFLSTALQESAFIMQNRALAILCAYLLAYGGDDDFGGNVIRWMAETWAVCLRFLGGHTFKIGKHRKDYKAKSLLASQPFATSIRNAHCVPS